MNGAVTIAQAGPYPYTSPITATLIGYARFPLNGKTWQPSDRPSRSVASPRIASATITASPAPLVPVPASTRPSPPCARATPWLCPNSTAGKVRPGCPRRRRPASGTRRETGPGPDALRPQRPHGEDVLQHPRHLRRVRSRPHPHAHPRGHGHRPRQGEIARQAAQTLRPAAAGTLPQTRDRRVFPQRSRRTLLRLKANRLSRAQPSPVPSACDPAPYRNRPQRGGMSVQVPAGIKLVPSRHLGVGGRDEWELNI